jgi:uncharacterized membrane protein
MTQKSFKIVRVVTAIFLAVVMTQAIIFNNYILAIIAIVGAITVTLTLRKKVNEVLVDERVISIGGKAARMTLSIFSVIGVAVSFILMFLRELNPAFELSGSVLAYSVCAVLLLYSFLFKYYEKQN